jgi:2-C-methyl-D-erythritol 2,4-cyclodiphosphate synthase
LRIGQGFDVHKFVEGRKLILGGEQLEHPLGLDGHSDADVVCHAIIDALLGAAGLGDIGMHFPDTDDLYKDASSIQMLETIGGAVHALGYRVHNLDVTIIAQQPRIGKFRGAMVENIAVALGVDPVRVNLKATTTEKLGFVGRSEGIAAMAAVLLEEGAEN